MVVALLSHTAFTSDMRLLEALNTENPSLATIQKLLSVPAIKDSINFQESLLGTTALIAAASSENSGIISALIAAGAKTTLQEIQANGSDTALLRATGQRPPSLAIVKALLNAPDIKNSINLKDSIGMTALMYTAAQGDLPTTQALLTAGADATIVTPTGLTALSVSQSNCAPAIQAALKK